MPKETQTVAGLCETHGEVEATREIPKISFPPIFTAVTRALAKRRRPYRCPTCGAVTKID